MTEGTEAPTDFTCISAEFARLYASARRMVWVAPAQTLIELRACGVVLVHRLLDGCSYDRGASFGDLLARPELRRLPVDRQVHLDWLRKKGNIAAHPERNTPTAALDRLAQEGLRYVHGLAVWFCVERLGLPGEDLPSFELPEQDTLDRVCGDAVLRNDLEALYLLGMHFKDQAVAERMRIQERLVQERVVMNTAAPLDNEAAHWFTRATRRQHVGAAYELGLATLHGRGCAQNIDEGLGLLEFAAEWDLADAQHQLAVYYLEGHVEGLRDVPCDHEAARRLLERAAAREHLGAFNCLMKIYSEGLGVPRDMSRALELARRSADAGYPLAQLNLANLYLAEGIPERRPDEVLELLSAAAEAGIPHALTTLFKVHRHGMRGASDSARAFAYLERAVSLSDPEAMIHMAAAYRSGDHVARNLHRAVDLLLRARRVSRLHEDLRRFAADELERTVAALRADITPRLIASVTTGLAPSLVDRQLNDFCVLCQALSPPPDGASHPWEVQGELAEHGFAGIKLLNEVVVALRTAPDRLAPAVRDELLRILPDLDLTLFRRPPARPLRAVAPSRDPEPAPTPVRASPKVGRNALCPCGSGSKYKRCCGAPT
ncbi:SEC-C metal-binding domain-containing protein [Nannocystis radixulma]|uniref:SEC-C metal-binding domain-containing protein n=1 Tax=Nannocystis radixulma TaxID=2995305 RepID=A0ABT5B516_9BACT|nr:SEC-C metal-binding domain-containing protein [Nannocystis radixulma]MDC0669225.1 SEC-C metal-binding domain-containing protein [Nannocystis radixulma]